MIGHDGSGDLHDLDVGLALIEALHAIRTNQKMFLGGNAIRRRKLT
jgi:hypothetical protein